MGVVVRQKVKGKGQPWWVFVSHNKQRTSKKVGDKQAAEDVASGIRKKIKLGEFNIDKQDKPEPLFKEYADSWIKTTVPATCKASTLMDYKDLLRLHVLPVFGELKITDIKRGKVKDFLLDKVNSGLASSTVTHMKNTISGVLNKAVDDEIIASNPAQRLGKIFKTQDIRKHIDPLTKDELHKLLTTVEKHYSRHYPLFLLLARTGLRVGEALALKWEDIDFNSRFINVQRNLSRNKIETPKNGKARRVDMSMQLTNVLQELKKQREKEGTLKVVVNLHPVKEKEKTSIEKAPEWVFFNTEGGTIDVNNWRHRVFNKVLEKAKLRKIRIHDLRHTYASLLIQAGESLAYVRDQLGHHSIKVTVDIYGHLAPEGNKQAVDRLDDQSFQNLNAPQAHPASSENEKGLAANG